MSSLNGYSLREATFNNIAGDYFDHRTTNVTVSYVNSKATMDRLLENISPGALHDSAERGPDAPKCHPETRKAVQQEIISWIRQWEKDDCPKKILWLSGPAGAGKTAIAGTIAEECHKEGLLAASFFFSAYSGSVNRRTKRSFVLTLVYALMQQGKIANLREAILSAIEKDPAIFNKHLDRQLEQLILAPLRAVAGQSALVRWPRVIIVDGVDECSGDDEKRAGSKQDYMRSQEDNRREILSVLAHASADPCFPYCIFIASRPEPAIAQFFRSSPDLALRVFLDNKYNPDSDIRLFLEAKLGAIQRKYDLSSGWVPQNAVDLLVASASGQFVYITTALRYVEDPSSPPHEQLKRVLAWGQVGTEPTMVPSLDTLYSGILANSPDPALAGKWILSMNGGHFYDGLPPWYKRAVLESSPGETTFLLGNLSSLISLADNMGEFSVQPFHKCFLDFLVNACRSERFHVREEDVGKFMNDRHYQILQNRGPQSPPEGKLPTFLEQFCVMLPHYICPDRTYRASDVYWWLGLTKRRETGEDVKEVVVRMFRSIDKKCLWSHCRHLPSCRVWRNTIRQHCAAESWRRVPSVMDLVKDWCDVKWRHRYGCIDECFQPPLENGPDSPHQGIRRFFAKFPRLEGGNGQ